MMAENSVDKEPLSCGQMEALRALCDTFLPAIDIHKHQFYQTSASMTATPHSVAVFLAEKVQHPKMYLARLALRLLSTWIGTFILCGTKCFSAKFPYLHRFSHLSSQKREQILLSWSTSYFFLLRLLYTALKIFTLLTFFTQVNENDENLSWKAIGYHGPDPARIIRTKKGEEKEEEEAVGPLHKGIINLDQLPKDRKTSLQNLGFPVCTQHNSKNSQFKSLNPSLIIQCDAVVVGSGSGGGVVAGVLAKAGYKVVVLEKGRYLAGNNLSLFEGQALDQMYLGNGIMGTDNLEILLLAGSTVGGGSTVNWSASIQTPPHVRKEWSEKFQLELFESKEYEQALDVVCKKMGVQSEIDQEGFNNMILRKGCQNLGYDVDNIPRNASSDHYCGWCCFGCPNGKKKGTSETWMVDLVESRNGVILTECDALKVITDHTTTSNGRKRAIGVAFKHNSHQGKERIVIVESKVTVAACGALCTPRLLKKSGLKNRHIGKNLHVHPVVMAWGYFPPDSWPEKEKISYQGGIMTAMSRIEADSGYGAIIQTPSLHPGMFSALMPWISGRDIKNRMLKFSRTAHVFALARDKGSGVINSTSDISYKLEDYDEENLRKGLEKCLRILAAAGAEEIGTHHSVGRVLKVKETGREEFERFVLEESLRPLRNLSSPMCSAHQMGSCRMGVDPTGSVVDPRGETWEVEGLFVADSSVFPTALGVNPMVTIQAIAYCTAQAIVTVLARKNSM